MMACLVLRNTQAVKAAGAWFCHPVWLGSIIIYAACVVWILMPSSNALCTSRVIVPSLGYALLLGSLVVKSYRIVRAFTLNAPAGERENLRLSLFVLGYVLLHVVLAVVYASVAGSQVTRHYLQKYNYILTCSFTPAGEKALWVILAFHGAPLLFGCYVSFRAASVIHMKQFDESRPISLAIYAITLSGITMVMVIESGASAFQASYTMSTAMAVSTFATVSVSFLPKLLAALRELRQESTSLHSQSPGQTTRTQGGVTEEMQMVSRLST